MCDAGKTELKKNGKSMKIVKQMFLVTLALWVVHARANWVITAPATEIIVNGASGSSTFTYDPDVSGTASIGQSILYVYETSPGSGRLPAPGRARDPFSSVTVVSAPSTFTAGTPFQVIVDWATLPESMGGVNVPSTFYIQFKLYTSDGLQTTSQNFNIAPVPESTQPIASCMLLGCGLVGFAGQRLLKKRAA